MAHSTSRSAKAKRRAANAQPERISLYDEVTAKIIAQLEEGHFPWVQPWASGPAAIGGALGPGLPRNALTARCYSGVNILILWGAAIDRGYQWGDEIPVGVFWRRDDLSSLNDLEPVLSEGGPLAFRPLGLSPDQSNRLISEMM